MHANALRTILLVKSVEDQDADGAMLTPAERESATREALRSIPASADAGARSWRVLEDRARRLQERLLQRHPVVAQVVPPASRIDAVGLALLLIAFLVGLSLSILDSRVRIEIVAFPLLGLVLWNLVVYVLLLVFLLRSARTPANDTPSRHGWVTWPLRWAWQRASALVRRASFYHRPLAAALRSFSEEWRPLAQPVLLLQGHRLFHLAAAAVALGLIAGFYVRGIALEYRAGWESTFLGPEHVRALLQVLYGPAAALTGIALPADAAAIEALHWRDGAGGEPASNWIHLMAVTACLYIVVPRLLLAAGVSVAIARRERALAPPPSLEAYARTVLAGSDAAPAAVRVRVTPFAYRPSTASLEGLQRLLRAAHGPGTQLEIAATVPYGEERAPIDGLGDGRTDLQVLLFNLAATPEAENHGTWLESARDALTASATTRLQALVDESPFLDHMRGDATLAARIEERRGAWRAFCAHHGCAAALVDLAALGTSTTVPETTVAEWRTSTRGVRG